MADAALPAPSSGRTLGFDWRAFLSRWGALLALALLILFNLAFTPNFATWQTLNVNLTQVCAIVIVGVGMTLVIATGGIDLSGASLMAIAGRPRAADLPGEVRSPAHPMVGVALAFVIPVLVAARSAGSTLAHHALPHPAHHRDPRPVHRRARHRQVLTNGNLQVFKVPEFQFIGLGRVFGIPFRRSSWW
jgi:ribose transport system permease protein